MHIQWCLKGIRSRPTFTDADAFALLDNGIPSNWLLANPAVSCAAAIPSVQSLLSESLLVSHVNLEELAPGLCSTVSDNPAWAETLVRTSLIRDETIAALSLDLTEQGRFTAVRAALERVRLRNFQSRLKQIIKIAESGKTEQAVRQTRAQEELGRALTALTEARSL